MKLSLDSLNKEDTGSSLPIDSLKGQETLPLGNDLSNTNRAAFASLAVGGDVVSNYQLFKDSLDINADDQPVKQNLQKVEQARQQRILGISGNMLVDPNVPDGVKATIPTYLQQQETPDARKIVAEQALFEDNGREGANQEAARSWVFNDIDATIQYKKDASKYVSLMDAYLTRDYSYFEAWKDVFAELVPGVKAVNVATIKEKVLAGEGKEGSLSAVNFIDSVFKSFENERDMRKMIENKPPQERMDMLRKIVGVVQSQYSQGMFDNNEYAIIERARMLIADPETPFSDQSGVSAVITDTVFNALSILGPSPKALKAALGATDSAEKVAPKVVFKEATTQAVDVSASPVVKAEPVVKQERMLDVNGITMSESEIAAKRIELSTLAENKFDRGTVKQLRSEQADLGNRIAQLEAEKLANKQNASQLAKEMKVSRKEAIRKTNKIVDEQIDEYKARIGGVKSKLQYSERGYLAESELSKFDQAVKAAKPVESAKADIGAAVRAAMDEAAVHNILGAVKPSSVVSTLAETNPTKASAFVKAAVDDETGALSKVVAGTSREELMIDASTVQPTVSKSVRVKPTLDFDESTIDYAIADSGIRYTAKEMKSLKDKLTWSVSNANGVTLVSPMSKILEDSKTGFKINATFMDGNVGFNDAQEALGRTEFALRGQGVGMDSLQLMKRTASGYEPVEKGVDIASLPKGDYAVQVNHSWGMHLESGFEDMKPPTIKNALDRMRSVFNGPVAMRQGSLTRHVWTPQTLFSKEFLLAPTVAADRAAGITKKLAQLADEFNKPFSKLPKEERAQLADYIIKANVNRIPFSAPEMIANGFTHPQVNVMSNWKRYWDTAYMLENADRARTLKLTGHKLFIHKESGTELFVRPQVRNAPINGKVYDPDTNMVLDLTAAGKKQLYDDGGYVAILRDHITQESGEVAKYVVVKERIGNYAREFNDSDRVLNYINGYYSVRHESPLFVVQNVKDKSGRILYKKAVAEAGSIADAEQMAKSLAARTEGHLYDRSGHDTADFFIREDIKTSDAMSYADASLDVGISSGRSSQRFRGAPLESYDPLAQGQSQYVQSPLESMSRVAYSLGNRLATRPYLETAKARWLENYGKFVEVDQTAYVKGFPRDPSEIGRNLTSSSELAQARTTWEYINSFEHGYESLVDVGTRSVIGIMADVVSKVPAGSVGKAVEGGLRTYAGSGKITSAIKTGVFNTMLVAQPTGMFVLQSIQSLANLSLNFLDPRLYRDLGAMHGVARGTAVGDQLARGKELWEAWERTGHTAAVDLHRAAFMGGGGSGRELGGFKATRAARTASGMLNFIQGFYNKGELINQYTGWLVKRLDFESVNKRPPSSQAELDTVHAEGRMLTYQMNKAGEMPYNTNTLNLSMQFFQVIHKAIMEPLASRSLSVKDRVRLGLAPAVIFGIPVTTMNWIDGNVEKSGLVREDKDKLKTALNFSVLSKIFGAMDADMEGLDYGKYNPVDPMGLADRLSTLMTYPEMFTRNPAASMLDKGLTAVVTMSRYLGITEADTGIQPNDEAMWSSLGNLLAGTSQYMKGTVLLENGVFRDKYGRDVAGDIKPVEAYAQKYFGMTPKKVTELYAFTGKSIELNQQFKDDLSTVIKNARQQLAMNGLLLSNPEYTQQLMSAVTRVFKNNPAAMEELTKQLNYDLKVNGKEAYLYHTLRAAGYLEVDELKELVSTIPNKEQKEYMLEMIDRGIYGRE